MSEVLFVCYANAIRSKMAAAYYNHFTDSHGAKSAGLDPGDSTKAMRQDVRQFLAEEGIQMSAWESRPRRLSERMVRNTGKIVLLTSQDLPEFVSKYPVPIDPWEIESPRTSLGLFGTAELIRQRVLSDIAMSAQGIELPK